MKNIKDWVLKGIKRGTAVLLAAAMAFAMPGVSGRAADLAGEGTLPNGKSVYNILLIGSDRRDESWNGNSDVVIVLTLNADTHKLLLTSFMRDLYAEIPGHGVHKLNYAYAVGGAETLQATLEDNYEIDIDNYAAVDFGTMAEIVDIIGGVAMDISDEECEVLNGYLISMEQEEDQLPGGGEYVLNGYQAVAYMRIRYVGDNDYERTQRQRSVLKEIFSSLQELEATELTDLVEEVFSEVDNDLGPVGLLKFMSGLPEYVTYDLEDQRIPYDGLYTSQSEMLVPDFSATIERLHGAMYGE